MDEAHSQDEVIGKVILGVLAFSCLPIWRGAGHPRTAGVNLWVLMRDSHQRSVWQEGSFGHEHLLYEEAVRRARAAYQLVKGG